MHWKLFYKPFSKIYPFLSPTLMAQSAWKNCSHKLFIVILHLRTLMPLIGLLWLTNSIFRSLFYIFFPLLAFVFLPSRLAAEWHWASPCWGALLSHSSAHFRCPLSSSPRQWAFDWIHYPSCCSVCCCFSIQEKRWIINDDRQKREKKKRKKSIIFRIVAECCGSIKRPVNKTVNADKPDQLLQEFLFALNTCRMQN